MQHQFKKINYNKNQKYETPELKSNCSCGLKRKRKKFI